MPDVKKLIIDGVQYDLPQGGGGVQNPVWTSDGNRHGDGGFGHIATTYVDSNDEAEIIVGGQVGIPDASIAQFFVANIDPNLRTVMGVTGTVFTLRGTSIMISGENSVVTDEDGNHLYFSSTKEAQPCIAVSATEDAYMTPTNSWRQTPIIPLYAYVEASPSGSDDALFVRVRAFIPSQQVLSQQQIVDELIQGGYAVFPFYCYGKVILN